ncbi:HAMP domain-containing sensor histidine kinase [Chitinophaga sp.]|uniref:sensor histidine kinase n=1 Tax=Chitinophaga sp. TaxID=1869181 RepID=UPI002F92991A
MKKNILLILILMLLCVSGIIGLQLFWNVQNYRQTVKNFDHDSNNALENAVAREINERQDGIVRRFETWLADTSLITITADSKNRYGNTVFHIRDKHPRFPEDQKRAFSFGLTDFKEKLNEITPQAKAMMIHHFGERMLKADLQKGMVYNYTELLGDSLEKVFNNSQYDPVRLSAIFKEELLHKNIRSAFVLNPQKRPGLFLTKPMNTHFRKPYQHNWVTAGLESPNSYFFKAMKWVVISSLLLIAITITCFVYTAQTLLSQEKLAKLRQAFVSNMTHELNTPIASIKITAEALRAFKNEPERQKEYLDIIGYQADKLSELTAQILETNEQVQKDQTNWSSFDLNLTIEQAISDLAPQAESAMALIRFEPAVPEIQLFGDRLKWRNVMNNLIDNALKYAKAAPVIVIETRLNGDMAQIVVADNGIGIPPEYRSKVMEPFFRVHQDNRHNVKGYGLGLSYVHQVVSAHGGLIAATGNEPAGTRITIQIPFN